MWSGRFRLLFKITPLPMGFIPRMPIFSPSATFREKAVGVLQADVLVELQKIQMIGLQAGERFIDLARGRLCRAAVEFGHQEDLVTVAILQTFAHAHFADAVVIVPRVVQGATRRCQ
jgi:hypothetical protein